VVKVQLYRIQLEPQEEMVVVIFLVITHLMVEILVLLFLLLMAVEAVEVPEELGVVPLQVVQEPLVITPQLVDPILLVHGLYLPLFLLVVDHLTH
jgi:hypothetical protein